ncbi:hypothetical protein BDR26DRAFT_914341 [Obelidium mucronatum]|nr:hypothetical protein BDR26DRAFT_914341 [Obelidium mucronatum]
MSSVRSNKIPAPLEQFELVGRGENHRPSDNAIIVDAGWNTDSTLNGAILLKVSSKLKSVRIIAEFRGYVETRWEGLSTLATQRESPAHKVDLSGRVFQQMVQVVYDSKDPILPHPKGGSLCYPFRFNLPRNNLPPTYDAIEADSEPFSTFPKIFPTGAIQYYIKCSIMFQEPFKLLSTTYGMDVPVIIGIPEAAKIKLLTSPSQLIHPIEKSETKLGCTVHFPRRIVQLGDTVEVNLAITSTPGDARIRSMTVSLRPVLSYLNNHKHLAVARVTESFPLLKIGGDDGLEPIMRQIPLYVDPAVGQASFESPLISVKTMFRLQIILDDSETPNVAWEVPIVVLPPLKESLPPPVATRQLQRSRSHANVTSEGFGAGAGRGSRETASSRQKRSDSLSARRFNHGAPPPPQQQLATPPLTRGDSLSSTIVPSPATSHMGGYSPTSSFLNSPYDSLQQQQQQNSENNTRFIPQYQQQYFQPTPFAIPPPPTHAPSPQVYAMAHQNYQYPPIVQRSQTINGNPPRQGRRPSTGALNQGLGFAPQSYSPQLGYDDPVTAILGPEIGGSSGVYNNGYEAMTREQQIQRATTEKRYQKRQEIDGLMSELEEMQIGMRSGYNTGA